MLYWTMDICWFVIVAEEAVGEAEGDRCQKMELASG